MDKTTAGRNSFSDQNKKNTERAHVYLAGFKLNTSNFESHKNKRYSVFAVVCNTL
jgi:hypothetical protein